MTIRLAQLVPHEQLLVVHAPLGEVEWPGTIEHIERTMPTGVPLIRAFIEAMVEEEAEAALGGPWGHRHELQAFPR